MNLNTVAVPEVVLILEMVIIKLIADQIIYVMQIFRVQVFTQQVPCLIKLEPHLDCW